MMRSVCLAALVGLGGCVIDSDVGELDLDLSKRRLVVDTADWELTDDGAIPAVDCTDQPKVCNNQVAMWCGADELCEATCGGETCEVNVLVALWDTVNLAQEKTDLSQLEGEPLVSVTIDRVTFAVSENTLSVPSPALTVSVAPAGVMSVAGGGAEVVGTIPALEAGETVADAAIELNANGQTVLARRMLEYQTPFNLVLGTTVELRAGDPVPSGRLVTDIKVKAHANTGL
ncbi:MAG TPA: hypothetical protein VNO33_15000 [Kofleriaceae bacterium]|nr:hypothetical protein [Kofleriaceae bacterium]